MCTYILFLQKVIKECKYHLDMQNADKKRCAAPTCLVKICCKWFIFAIRRLSLPPPPKSDVTFFHAFNPCISLFFKLELLQHFLSCSCRLQKIWRNHPFIFCYLSKKATVAFSGVMNYKRGSLKTSQFPCLRLLFLVLVCILVDLGPKTLSSLFLLGSLTSKGIFKIIGKLQNIFW